MKSSSHAVIDSMCQRPTKGDSGCFFAFAIAAPPRCGKGQCPRSRPSSLPSYRPPTLSADVSSLGHLRAWRLSRPTNLPSAAELGHTHLFLTLPLKAGRPVVQLVINTFGARLRRVGDRFLVKARDKEIAFS